MTMLSINNMRSHLTEGGARPSLFQVIITNPVTTSADQHLPFMVKAAQLPTSSLGKISVGYMGRQYPIPGDRVFQDWSTSIINDENFLARNAIEQWSAAINSHRGNIATRGSAPANYMSQATVTQFGKAGQILRIYQFNDIWPLEVGSIDLDWNSADTIEEFPVTWAYTDWKIIGGTTGDAGGDQ